MCEDCGAPAWVTTLETTRPVKRKKRNTKGAQVTTYVFEPHVWHSFCTWPDGQLYGWWHPTGQTALT